LNGPGYIHTSIVILLDLVNGTYAIVDGNHQLVALSELNAEGKIDKDMDIPAYILKAGYSFLFS
jgi:hypothetical protein